MNLTLIMFIFISVDMIAILIANNLFDRKKFVQEVTPYFGFLKEKDYEYLLKLKYGDEIDSVKMFNKRIKNAGLITILFEEFGNISTAFYNSSCFKKIY